MDSADIELLSTRELCEELARRKGVDCVCVEPYDPFELIVNGGSVYKGTGSYCTYLVYD